MTDAPIRTGQLRRDLDGTVFVVLEKTYLLPKNDETTIVLREVLRGERIQYLYEDWVESCEVVHDG